MPFTRNNKIARETNSYATSSLDAYERVELESQARQQYYETLKELRRRGAVTESEVRQFKRAQIINKSLQNVKDHADYAKSVRRSPDRYGHVQSKVKRCL